MEVFLFFQKLILKMYKAFEYLDKFVNELAAMGKIDNNRRSDLLKRSRASSNFVSCKFEENMNNVSMKIENKIQDEQRIHMEKESTTINHCIRYLLSDPNNKEFASPCHLGPRPHTHESVCNECLEVLFLELLFVLLFFI